MKNFVAFSLVLVMAGQSVYAATGAERNVTLHFNNKLKLTDKAFRDEELRIRLSYPNRNLGRTANYDDRAFTENLTVPIGGAEGYSPKIQVITYGGVQNASYVTLSDEDTSATFDVIFKEQRGRGQLSGVKKIKLMRTDKKRKTSSKNDSSDANASASAFNPAVADTQQDDD